MTPTRIFAFLTPGVVSIVVSMTACNGTSASEQAEQADLDAVSVRPSTISMGVGVLVDVPDSRVGIRLDSVSADSRCPSDVQCVHAGNATAHLYVVLSEPHVAVIGPERVALTTASAKDTVRVFGRHLRLVRVQPTPQSTRRIEPSEYRVELRVGGEK
ncbi:MAG: hypothetical protein ACO1Q7_10720 [Gemmatimonas sp.]